MARIFATAIASVAAAANRLAQVAVVFPVKPPDGVAWEYRWRFSDGSCGPWQALGDRREISGPPAATGVEWRPAPPIQPAA